MRYLVLLDHDHATTVEADTAAEAARIVAQAIYGPGAGAYPLKHEYRRAGGPFSIMERRWEGAPLRLVGRITVEPMERVRRGRDLVSPPLPARIPDRASCQPRDPGV